MTSRRSRDPLVPAAVLLVRSIPLRRDSRSTKMAAAYRAQSFRVIPLVWSRGEPREDGDAIVCTAPGGYGDRLKGIYARLRWMLFLARKMFSHRNSYEVVHTVDLDTAIIAVPMALLLRKTIVYDAFDSIIAILGEGSLSSFLAMVERQLIARSKVAIFPDRIRLEQYGVDDDSNVVIVSNIPDQIAAPTALSKRFARSEGDDRLRCVYVGTLEAEHRGLEYIGKICRSLPDHVEFVVGGTGQIEQRMIADAQTTGNFTYLGRMDYHDALDLMMSADILYAPYLLSAPAHRFASPNKVYEHFMLGKAMLTNSDIPPATIVTEARSGFIFDGTLESAISVLANLDRHDCEIAGKQASDCWNKQYATLRDRQLERFFDALASGVSAPHATDARSDGSV